MSFTRKVDDQDWVQANDINELQEAIEGNDTRLDILESGIYNVLHYGATGDGVTDDTAAIQAAIDAAAAVDGTVYLPVGTYAISGEVSIPQYVSFLGAGRGNAQGDTGTTFLAIHADAFLDFEEPSYSTIGYFTFNGDDLATKGIRASTSHKSSWRDISVRQVNGDSMRLHNVQNASFDNIETFHSDRGMWVDDGCGSCVFNALSSHDNVEWQLKVGTSGTVSSGYDQPTAITFVNPMLEWISADPTTSATGVVVLEGCDHALFLNPILAGEQGSATSFHMIRASIEGTATVCKFMLVNAQINNNGGTNPDAALSLADAAEVHFVARNQINGAAIGVLVDGANARVLGDKPTMISVTTPYSFTGGAASFIATTNLTHEYPIWITPHDTTLGRAIMAAWSGDAGLRYQMNGQGTMAWGDGSDFNGDTNLFRGGANILKTDDKFVAAAGIGVGNSAAATTPGTVTKKIEVFDASGASLGFIAVYDGIS